VASAALFTSTVSYGYVMWLLRGGLLLSSLLSSLPAWASLDPLPILASGKRARKTGTEKTDSVEMLFGQTGNAEQRHAGAALIQVGVGAPPPVALSNARAPRPVHASRSSGINGASLSVASAQESHG
jgi:hypothetical protein